MIRGVNADQFARELEREMTGIDRDVTEVENDFARELLADARQATPVDRGDLLRAWGVAVGQPDPTDTGGGEEAIDGRLPQQKLYVYNNQFYATFVEDGTPHAAPRPMVGPALERLDRQVVRL